MRRRLEFEELAVMKEKKTTHFKVNGLRTRKRLMTMILKKRRERENLLSKQECT